MIKSQNFQKIIKDSLENKYYTRFNFYFAKPVHEILTNVKNSYVIKFLDDLFYDDDNEYLKRYYTD